MKYYILMSGPELLPYFEPGADLEDWWWTVSPSAKVGDQGFIYLTAPVSRIVAQVEITGAPFNNIANVFDNPKCDGKWMSPINLVRLLPARPELTIQGLRLLFGTDWGWVRYPRGRTTIPAHIIKPFLELVNEGEQRK